MRRLQNTPGVTLYGYLPIEKTRELMARADLFINTSHDEGLGLPLLEAQYGGLPVIAPNQKVFQEVLGESGLLVDPIQAARGGRADRCLDQRLGLGQPLQKFGAPKFIALERCG